MAKFKKRNDITTDTMVSQYFSDMYDGGTATADLLGGMKQSKYLLETEVADKPTFGAAELTSLELDIYVNSITIGENSVRYPEVASYLFKKNDIGITEGYQSRIDADILTFTSINNNSIIMRDNFNGASNSGGDSTKYTNIKRSILGEDSWYTTVSAVHDYGYTGKSWYHGKDAHSEDSIRTDFGITAAKLGVKMPDGYPTGADYVKLGQVPHERTFGQDRYKCIPNAAHAGIGHSIWIGINSVVSGNQNMSTTDGYGTEATPSNTIFESVRGSAEYSGWNTDAETTDLFGVGICRFNTVSFLTQGSSLEMFSFWTGDSTNKAKVLYSSKRVEGNGRDGETGPSDRQEIVLVKKNIPYPAKSVNQPSIQMDGAIRTVKAVASSNNFHQTSHSLQALTPVKLSDIAGTISGLSATTQYYVRTNNLTDDTFQISTSNAGSATAVQWTDSADQDYLTIKKTNIDNYDDSKFAASIELDVNIKDMTTAYYYRPVSGTLIYDQDGNDDNDNLTDSSVFFASLRRGFHIIFATTPPKDDETLYDYVGRMSNLDKVSGADRVSDAIPKNDAYKIRKLKFGGATHEDDEGTLWSVRGSGFGAPETTATHLDGVSTTTLNQKRAYFAGVSFLQVADAEANSYAAGIQCIPWNGSWGSGMGYGGSTTDLNWKRLQEGLYINDHDSQIDSGNGGEQDLLFYMGDTESGVEWNPETEHGAGGDDHTVPMLDQWKRLTFVCSPTDSHNCVWDASDYDAGNTTAKNSKGHHSFGRLYISNPDDGTLVNPVGGYTNGAAILDKPYVDLMLMGNNGNSVSYDEEEDPIALGALEVGKTYEVTAIDGTASNITTDAGGVNTVGAVFVATGTGTGGSTGRVKNLEKSPANWPKHMSIWVTNYKSEVTNDANVKHDSMLILGSDSKVKVLLDSLRFRGFNYDITNSSQIDGVNISSPLRIESGKCLKRGTKDESSTSDKIDSRFGSTPSVLSFGLKNRDYLSQDAGIAATNTSTTWTEWPYGFWLNNFQCDNLSAIGAIPDDYIKAGFSYSAYEATGGVDDGPKIIPLGSQLWQKGLGHMQEGVAVYWQGTIVPHNNNVNFEDYGSGATRQFATSFLNTGLIIATNNGSAKTFVCQDNALFTGGGLPIRVGDTVRLTHNVLYTASGKAPLDFTVSAVTSGTVADDLSFTVSETVPQGEKATFETTSFTGTNSGQPDITNNTVDIDGTQITFAAGVKSAATMAGLVAAAFPSDNYTAAVTNTDKVTFTQRVGGTGGNIDIVMSDATYKYGGTLESPLIHTIAKEGGGTAFEGGTSGFAGYFVSVGTPGLCRNFSQKGGMMAYTNSNTEFVATKRENIACSARIMEIEIQKGNQCVIQVDNTEVFRAPPDEEYIVYLFNGNPTFTDVASLPDRIADDSPDCKTGLKVISVDHDTKLVTLDWVDAKDNAGTEILTYGNMHRLFVSPYRYWLYVVVRLESEDGELLSSRSYGNVTLMNNNWTDKNSTKRSWTGEALHGTFSNDYVDTAFSNRSGFGTTFNEFLYNDTSTGGVNGAYLNNWNLDRMKNHSVLDCDTDFGFGSFDEETSSGGHTGATVVKEGQYNKIKMPNVVEAGDIEEAQTVNFLIDYKDVGLTHKTTLSTRGNTNPPYLYSVFEDEIPVIPKLSVAPYEEDPFLTEFTWEASDADLWYGLLHIDTKSIDSQYHNAIFHLPMNETGIHGAVVSVAGNTLYYNNTDAGAASKTALFTFSGAKIDVEGLAGYCTRFDGTDDTITYTPTSGNVFSDITNAASIVVHVVPDNGIDGTSNWIWKGAPFNINYDADNGKVVVDCYTAASNYVRLTSPDIITDGQTPTCIAATIDPDLKSGNCKLFINGALVDQSGSISSSAPGAAGNNWHNASGTPKPAFVTTGTATVGAASGSFLGRIEELVIYNKCIYPVVPSVAKFVFDKPLREIQNNTAISNNARLFVKDYHNIRGSTTTEVAASSSVSFRKAAFRLVD